MRGQLDEGEAVYRAAMQRFPDSPVVWIALGQTLRLAHRHDEALTTFRQAQQRFPRYPIIATGLTAVLIELGDDQAASDSLAWTEQVCDDDNDNDQRVLADLRQRYKALLVGRPWPL